MGIKTFGRPDQNTAVSFMIKVGASEHLDPARHHIKSFKKFSVLKYSCILRRSLSTWQI